MVKKFFRTVIYLFILSCSGGGELNNPAKETVTVPLPSVEEVVEVTDTPTLATTTPASPAIDGAPFVNGQAEAEAAVMLFSDSSCTINVGTGTASDNGNFTIAVNLEGGASKDFFAIATAPGKDPSLCSTSSVTYKNNSIRPGLAWLTGTETTAPGTPTKVNQATAFARKWSGSEFDGASFEHQTETTPETLTVKRDADYWISATLPLQMTAGNMRPTTRLEVRVNGTLVPGAIGESSYIRLDPVTGNSVSSSHLSLLLEGLSANDRIQVFVKETAGDDGSEVVNITGAASMLVEYVDSDREIFRATATRTVASTDINQAGASALEWTASRKGIAFTHDNLTNPENISLSRNGDYLITVNAPITSTAQRASPKLLVRINGTVVKGSQSSQGYIRADSGHNEASIHWSGVVSGIDIADVLSVTSQLEANTGTVNLQAGSPATITIEKLDTSSKTISLRGTSLISGNNWNPAAKSAILWNTSVISDTALYTHSIVSDQHQVTVNDQGDYQLIYNDALTSTVERANPIIKVQINGLDVPGAEVKTHYIRSNAGHDESSASLVFLLRNLSSGDIITVTAQQDIATGIVDDLDDALLTIIKK